MTSRSIIFLRRTSAAAGIVVAALAFAAPAARAAALRSAGPFLLDDIRYKADGKWSLAWDTLYPAHQLVASRATYVRCEESTPFAAPLQSAEVVGVRRAAVHVPGGPTLEGATVTVRISVPFYGPRDPIVFTHTFHVVPVDGHWTWLLSAERYAVYRHDGCGSFPAA
ncbi:MAG TPA: hypothetical protein VJQ85_10560 [Gaiellaceae bacterium]|nr:hypothetical protein [Gaiellaceae bacterium]